MHRRNAHVTLPGLTPSTPSLKKRKCFERLVSPLSVQVRSAPSRIPVQRYAREVVGPKVREMDENEMMDPAVIKGLFEQGVR